MFVHTQVPAILLGSAMRQVPTVVSLDATPVQYDALGEHYAHAVGPRWLERIKTELNRRCFDRAEHLVTWADWTKESLAVDYGIDRARVTVIPPGVDVERWEAPVGHERPEDGITRILFVGGDLDRKGGRDLIEAFAVLHGRYGDLIELHLVTPTEVKAPPGVTVHRTMTPNSAELIALYHRCHVFCLPTRGDCLPMVLPEAGAAGLALVSTDVGAIGEIVRNGETGLLVPVRDVPALVAALDSVVTDHGRRRRLGSAANELVRAEHNASINAGRIAAAIESSLDRRRAMTAASGGRKRVTRFTTVR